MNGRDLRTLLAAAAAASPYAYAAFASGEYPPSVERQVVGTALLLVAFGGVASLVRDYRNDRRRYERFRRGCCPACGYDLRASPDRCPECGRAA